MSVLLVIQVECAKFDSGPGYAVVIGQSGLTLGLALYEDLRVVRKTQAGKLDDEEHAHRAVVLSMTYGEQTDLTGKDLAAVSEHRWSLAGPEAYPSIFKKERGLALRPSLSWELELMEGCLRAVPEFINRRQQNDPVKEEITVPVASGTLRLVLAWVVEREPEGNSDQGRDYLLDTVHKQWGNLLQAYQQFADQKPIVLFDLQEQRIYVYPYEDFKNEMSPSSQESLTEQYEQAVRENKMVVFVRDNEQRQLGSFSINIE
jgi:hypothetical protein